MSALTLLRGLLLLTFPVGWYFSYSLVESQNLYYLLLTGVCTAATAVILVCLGKKFKRSIHFWIILLVCWAAYFLKFYILCYMKANQDTYSDFLELSYGKESSLLELPELIITYYELVTAVWLCFAMVMVYMTSLKKSYFLETSHRSFAVRNRTVTYSMIATVLFSIFMISVQMALGLGIVSAGEGKTIELPFRLAGIIMTVNIMVLPLIYLVLVWLADQAGSRKQFVFITGAYLAYGLTSGLISTSREKFITVALSLLVLWLITEKMSRQRAIFLIALTPFIVLLNGLLSVNRILRSIYPDLDGLQLFYLAMTQYIAPVVSTYSATQTDVQISAFLSTILRVNGVDSLLHILDYAPGFSWERFLGLFFDGRSSAEMYATEILELPQLIGVAFSPSLFGFFILAFGQHLYLIVAAFTLYLLTWHLLFKWITSFKLLIEPIILALMFVMLARFTSEGTLESLPLSIIFLLFVAGVIEILVRRLVKYPRGVNQPRAASPL